MQVNSKLNAAVGVELAEDGEGVQGERDLIIILPNSTSMRQDCTLEHSRLVKTQNDCWT
jgi:hypothetical protein